MFLFCCVQAYREVNTAFLENDNDIVCDSLMIENIHVPSSEEVVLEEYSLEKTTPIIAQLVRGKELSIEDIQQISQAVLYVEARYLLQYNPPALEVGEFDWSYYDMVNNKVFISLENIRNLEDYLLVLIHMGYHVYQKELIDVLEHLDEVDPNYTQILIFQDVVQWKKELAIYSGCTDAEHLFIEKSAHIYAKEALPEYINAIKSYWDGFEYEEDEIEEVAMKEVRNEKWIGNRYVCYIFEG